MVPAEENILAAPAQNVPLWYRLYHLEKTLAHMWPCISPLCSVCVTSMLEFFLLHYETEMLPNKLSPVVFLTCVGMLHSSQPDVLVPANNSL